MKPDKSTIPTPQQRREIAACAIMPERQVLRVYRAPERAKPSTLARVDRAAIELGISPPLTARVNQKTS